MTQAQMIVAVIAPRLATGGALSPLTAGALAVIAARRGALSSAAVSSAGRGSRGKGDSSNDNRVVIILGSKSFIQVKIALLSRGLDIGGADRPTLRSMRAKCGARG